MNHHGFACQFNGNSRVIQEKLKKKKAYGSGWLKFSEGHEADFHTLPQGRGNPPEHGEGRPS